MQSRANEGILISAVLVVVIGWRLQDFFQLGMTNTDQLLLSTDLLKRGIWEVTTEYARSQGRIYFLLSIPIDLLVSSYPTTWSVQVATLGLFAVAPPIVAWMVFRDRDDQAVFLLAYWGLAAVGWYFTTPAAYPIIPSLPLLFAGLAALFGRSYLRTGGGFKLLASCLLAFAAFFQYEPATLIAIALLWWFIHNEASEPRRKRHLYVATALALAVYVGAYVCWKWAYPTAYEAAQLGAIAPGPIARVLAAHSIGALPFANVMFGMPRVMLGDAMTGREAMPYPGLTIQSLLAEIRWMDAVVCAAAAALLWLLLSARSPSSGPTQPAATTRAKQVVLGLLLLLCASILLAVTAKYQRWALSWKPYLTSYYALFGWVVIVTAALAFACRRWLAALLVLAFSVVFLYSGAYNRASARQVRANFSKWQTVGALAACAEQLKGYDGFVLPAAFQSVFELGSNWSTYWRDWTLLAFGSPLHIVADTRGATAGTIAFVRPDRDGEGNLRAVVGRSGSRGFLIYPKQAPTYLRLLFRVDPGTVGSGGLVAVESLDKRRCRDGYHMVDFIAANPMIGIDVHWHLPDSLPESSYDPSLFVVPDAEVELAIQVIYLASAQRPADPGGRQYWADLVRRAGGAMRDVAEAILSSSEQGAAPLATDFDTRLAQSYQRLVGRPPRPDELERLNAFGDKPALLASLPWLVAADLRKANDAIFLNRLKLAQFYTDTGYPAMGWRADVWERSSRSLSESPDSLQQAMATIRKGG